MLIPTEAAPEFVLCGRRSTALIATQPPTEAIALAGTGNDVIQFSISSATITVGSTLPAIANSGSETLTIDGTTQNITVDGATTFQVMSVNAGATLALNNLTIAHGLAAADGGGVLNNGALTVASCNFSNNSADSGGAISSSSTGTLSITQSTFSGNSATSFGGALLLHNGASISNSTFSANNETTSGFDQGGGAIWTDGGGTNVTEVLFRAIRLRVMAVAFTPTIICRLPILP